MDREEICFSTKSPEEEISSKERSILCFFNLHNIWWANNKEYGKAIKKEFFKIFPDGKTMSRLLKIPQQRGPAFTKRFFLSEKAKNKKHFFMGLEEKELGRISKITNVNSSNIIPYHSKSTKNRDVLILPKDEIEKISSLIEKNNIDYVWLGISSPKQEFIANQLFDKTKAEHFICIGAGLDFLLKKKKEAPSIWQNIGLEWLYRLITDFKHSRIKVQRSFVALWNIFKKKQKIAKND